MLQCHILYHPAWMNGRCTEVMISCIHLKCLNAGKDTDLIRQTYGVICKIEFFPTTLDEIARLETLHTFSNRSYVGVE